jgi:response regulator RpfG family c-di-GMP phosphodiesterase
MTDKARILFVDDEKRVLNAMRGLFRRHYELFLTCEGAEAVRLAVENDVDVIVADQRMPGMTGIEVLAEVKQRSPRTVRILLTGYADPTAVEGSINLGEVFRFLSKPCPPRLLRETLSLAIDAARTSPAANEPVTTPTRPAAAEVPAPPPLPAANDSFSVPDKTDDSGVNPAPPIENLKPLVPRSPDESSSHWQSVTNVVMSEDTVEETSEHRALTSTNLALANVGVVVFTVDSEFAATTMRALSGDRNAVLATTLIKVAEAIQQQNAGVLITDFTSNKSVLQKIIGALKKYMPELVTIVVSNGRDTTDMISLINFGQVFRYLLKPIDPENLRRDIDAAILKHLYLLNNPESAKRHEVNTEPQAPEASSTVSEFLGKVRSP